MSTITREERVGKGEGRRRRGEKTRKEWWEGREKEGWMGEG